MGLNSSASIAFRLYIIIISGSSTATRRTTESAKKVLSSSFPGLSTSSGGRTRVANRVGGPSSKQAGFNVADAMDAQSYGTVRWPYESGGHRVILTTDGGNWTKCLAVVSVCPRYSSSLRVWVESSNCTTHSPPLSSF